MKQNIYFKYDFKGNETKILGKFNIEEYGYSIFSN